MRIIKDAIITHASEGRITMQVPEFSYGTREQYVELPDEWFCRLVGASSRPVVGKESSFLFLTRIGYANNKHDLRTAFESAIARGRTTTTWVEYELIVEQHFQKVEKQRRKLAENLQKKLDTLNKFVV